MKHKNNNNVTRNPSPCRMIFTFLIVISIFCGCGRKHYELSHTIKYVETFDIIYISPYEAASTRQGTELCLVCQGTVAITSYFCYK